MDLTKAHDRTRWAALLFCILFFAQGLALIPYPGVQNDEALFASGIYRPFAVAYTIRIFKHDAPAMLMSYVGALKVWLYKAVFAVWPPSPYSLRVPVLAIGAITVWLFYLLLRAALGRRAALAGGALLAFDTTFVVTTCFDWGPVALQHLLLVGGALLLVQFHCGGRLRFLAGGFFLLGLGLWDKAIFAWMLAGLGVATLVVFPRALRVRLTARNLAVAILSFLIGAWPLVRYNVKYRLDTFSRNTRYSSEAVSFKAYLVWSSLEGGSVLGYLTRDQAPPRPGRPANTLEGVSLALSEAAGRPQAGFLAAAFALALLLLPVIWRTPARSAVLFSIIFMAVTWVQMAFTRETGGGTHHTVLLWPFPHLAVAASFAEASRRLRRGGLAILIVVIVIVCGSNLLVTNEHLAEFIRNGPGPIWTDAIYALHDYVNQHPARQIFVMDWGMMDSLRALGRGRLPLLIGSDPFSKDSMTGDDRRFFEWMMQAPDSLFLGHTPGNEVLAGVSARLDAATRAAGYRKEVLQVIDDRHGRPMFEVFRYVRAAGAGS